MKLSCLQENLGKGLGIVGRAVATRTTLPITQNVLMVADESRLRLSATNLEMAITTWIGAKIDESGTATVPARLLTDFVNSLPSGRIDLEISEDPKVMTLHSERSEAQINGTDADEFPPLPTIGDGVVAKVRPDILRTAINQVVFAAATEDSRPVLTGVRVEFEGSRFVFAAADGFRLAVHRGDLAEPIAENIQVTIPAKTLSELNRLLSNQDEPVEFTITPTQNQVLIRLKEVELVSQLTHGDFPNYAQLIPKDHGTRAIVDLKAFLRATRTASVFARDGSGIVRLQLIPGSEGNPGQLEVSSRADEIGEHKGQLDVKIEGEGAKIAFSARYLTDVLSTLDGEEIIMEATTSSSPGVFRPADGSSYVHVVMPMFVQW